MNITLTPSIRGDYFLKNSLISLTKRIISIYLKIYCIRISHDYNDRRYALSVTLTQAVAKLGFFSMRGANLTSDYEKK